MPEHVGLILDGNRRYARKQGFPDPGRAYEMGARKLDEVLLWCNELGIPAVTLWVCSTENLKRSHAEVSEILGVSWQHFHCPDGTVLEISGPGDGAMGRTS